MALTLEAGPWSFSVNNAWASGASTTIQSKNALMAYKTALTSIGWSVVASSDSVSVKNVGDGSPDLWASTANIIFAASGAHSWIIFKDTVMNFYLTVDCFGTTGPNPILYLYYNSDIGTNGTISALPSGTKQQMMGGTHYWTTSSSSGFGGYVHAMKSSDGKSLRVFNFTRTAASTYGSSMILIEKLADAPSVFTEDAYFISQNSSIATSATITSQTPTWANIYGQTVIMFNIGSGRTVTTVNSSYVIADAYWSTSGTSTRTSAVTAQPTWYSTYIAQPIGFCYNSSGATNIGHVGRIRDLWLGSDGNATYSTYPSTGTYEFCKFGILITPWSGSAPLGG